MARDHIPFSGMSHLPDQDDDAIHGTPSKVAVVPRCVLIALASVVGMLHAVGVAYVATSEEILFAPSIFILAPIFIGMLFSIPTYCLIAVMTRRLWPVVAVACFGVAAAAIPYQPDLFGFRSSIYKANPIDDNWSFLVQVAVLVMGVLATGAGMLVGLLWKRHRRRHW